MVKASKRQNSRKKNKLLNIYSNIEQLCLYTKNTIKTKTQSKKKYV